MALKFWRWLVLASVLVGCNAPLLTAPSSAGTQSVPTAAAVTRAPTPTPLPMDTGWRTLAPGFEFRELRVEIGPQADRLRIARIDPAQARLRVVYDPESPR